MTKMSKRIGLRAYARHRGCSPSAVSRAIAEKRLTASVKRDAKGHPKIDVKRADIEWAAKTNPAQVAVGPTPAIPADECENHKVRFPGDDQSQDGIPSFEESRAKREAFSAKLKELEYEKASGKLAYVSEVRKENYAMSRMVRDSMLRLPDRFTPQLAAMTDQHEIRQFLKTEITEALWGLTREISLGDKAETEEDEAHES
jgi:hypothetical protein